MGHFSNKLTFVDIPNRGDQRNQMQSLRNNRHYQRLKLSVYSISVFVIIIIIIAMHHHHHHHAPSSYTIFIIITIIIIITTSLICVNDYYKWSSSLSLVSWWSSYNHLPFGPYRQLQDTSLTSPQLPNVIDYCPTYFNSCVPNLKLVVKNLYFAWNHEIERNSVFSPFVISLPLSVHVAAFPLYI